MTGDNGPGLARRLRTLLGGRVVPVRAGEGPTAWLMFAYAFLAMSAYNVLRPVTRSQVIGALGADNLPYVQLGAGLLIGVLMQGYGRLSGWLPRQWLIPLTQAGEAGLLFVFWLLFMTGAAWVSVAFYVLGLILGILLISQFWILANDIYDPRQAKRLFGFIGGGASLGGAVGAGVTAMVVNQVGTNNLLIVSAAVLGFCAVLVAAIVRRHHHGVGPMAPAARGVGGAEAFSLLARSRHLQMIALVIGAGAVGAGLIEQQLNMAAESIGGGATDSITAFLARVTFYVSIIGLIIQVGLTSRIHRYFGLGFALLILPIGLGATATLILVTGALWAPAAARVIDASLRYTVDKTTREVLFLPLPSDIRARAKPFVDVTVDRLAKALGALLILVLIKPWGLGLDWRQLSYASLSLMAVWVILAAAARREYLRSFRRSLGDRAIAPAGVRLNVVDASTIETLVEELSSPDEEAVLYAIDLLETLEKRHLVTPLLLHHQSARVRARALVALEAAHPRTRTRWLPLVESMLEDDDVDVRAAAVQALAVCRTDDWAAVMRRHLDDPNARVAVTAAAALATSADPAAAAAAARTLQRHVADTRLAAAPARRDAASAIGRIRHPSLHRLLLPLMHDPDPMVAREAIRGVRASASGDPIFVPALVSLLGHRTLKRDAREALLGYGESLVDLLAYLLSDRDEVPWVRRHVPGTLARIPTQPAMNALVAALDDADGFVRYKALEGVEHLHRGFPALAFDRATIEKLMIRETTRYYECLSLKHNLVTGRADARSSLLVRTLDDRLVRTIDRVYRLLGLLYPWKDVTAARHTIEHGAGRARAGAVEYLDTLIGGALRRRVIPLLDELTPDEQARHANLVLHTRPRDVEDTLAQLIHDEDPVLAAAAIHFCQRRQLRAFTSDLEFARDHRPPSHTDATEAASWALRDSPDATEAVGAGPLPAVEVVDRLRAVPLFEFVSVDELFRIARLARQVSDDPGSLLYGPERPVTAVRFLVAGQVRVGNAGGTPRELAAPAALGAECALEGRAMPHAIHAVDRVVCFAIDTGEFLTMIGESPRLAQGVFRMLLAEEDGLWLSDVRAEAASSTAIREIRASPLQPVDKVFLLRAHPLFARAPVEQLLALAGAALEMSVPGGATLFREIDSAALYYLISGSVRLEQAGLGAVVVDGGQAVGIMEVLTGVPPRGRATASTDVLALVIPAADLFHALADEIDLLQSLCAGLLALVRAPTNMPR